MGFPVCVHLFYQFLGIVLGCLQNLFLHLFLGVGVGLDVCAVYKYRLGRKVSRLCHFLKNPTEYRDYRLLGKAVPEIIAHCGKIGYFLLQCVPQKPAIGYS